MAKKIITVKDQLAREGDYDLIAYRAGFDKAREMAAEKVMIANRTRTEIHEYIQSMGEEEAE